MRVNIYSIFDTATAVYSPPFYQKSDGEALRTFQDIAKNPETDIGKHPEDYSMFRLGTFDNNKAKYHIEDKECLCTALEILATVKRDQMEPDLPLGNGGTPYKPGLTD